MSLPVLLVVLAIAIVVGIGALRVVIARKRVPAEVSNWAGDEFARLSDAERCDLVFAVAALGDDASRHLLMRALDDPSEAVALAAARSLAHQGERDTLERYFSACSRERARTLRLLVEILN